jgi:UDP-N-acetylmuramoyl-tripeptide--D-alanyl-D-alanine ligase
MGMRGLGQIAWLASFAKPDIGLITNIAPVHLELVGTVENVAKAKAELIEALPSGGTAVVPHEPLLEPYLTRTDIEIRRFGDGGQPRLETSLTAPHQLRNLEAALVVCDVLGVAVADTLEVEFSPLREQVIELASGVTLLNDCYNANPASMQAALEHLSLLAGDRRKVAVLGDMAELGDEARSYHRAIGAELARRGVTVLVSVGELARLYADAADGVETTHVPTAADAAAAVAATVRPGDVVLIKGSRSVGLEAVAAKLNS